MDTKEEILGVIKALSVGQGFYGRLYRKLTDNSVESNNFINELINAKLKDAVDLAMYIEC